MKPTGRSLGHLMLAATCMAWAGCGGGDVPDPSSDSAAATEPTAKTVDGAAVADAAPTSTPTTDAAPATAQGAPGVMPAARGGRPTPVAAAASGAPATDAPPVTAATDPSPPVGEPAATTDAPKADTSGTDEMMRMASSSTPATPAGDPATTATAPSPAPAGGMPAAGVMPRGGRSGEPDDRSRSVTQDASPAAPPGGGEMPAAGVMPGMRPGGGEPGRRGGGGGGMMASADGPGPGSMGGGGGNSDVADPGPGAFREPNTAVQAFLSALKAKNKDRLSQATARHAATESAERNRKLFAAILEQSISDEELDDIAKKLEGFQVRQVLQAKSSGSFSVLIAKQDNRDMLQRTVTVRHEKEGWKVQDLSGVTDFKPVGTYRNPIGRRK